jgi:hypothetical protein
MATIAKAGAHTIRLTLPGAARAPGTDTVRLTSTAPDGHHHFTTTLILELTK